MKNAILEVGADGVVGAVRRMCTELLNKGIVDALLVPRELPSKENVVQSLVTSPESLDGVNPLAPVLPVTTARIVSQMTKVDAGQKKIGVIGRSCEFRALVELTKLKQANLENITLIGIDCFGTYPVVKYQEFTKASGITTEDFLKKAKEGKEDSDIRDACQVCEYPHPLYADIVIGLIGLDSEKEILLIANTLRGEATLDELELVEGSGCDQRERAIDQRVSARQKQRDEVLGQVQSDAHGLDNLSSIFSPCIGCHNCRDVCPVCYCKECVFDSSTFEFEADKYLDWASRKGGLRMPTDTLLFHLTRLNHMGTSCVGCGLCQEACPNGVPVFSIFRLVGSKMQEVFDYIPGRSLDDELPLTTFKEDELQQVGYE